VASARLQLAIFNMTFIQRFASKTSAISNAYADWFNHRDVTRHSFACDASITYLITGCAVVQHCYNGDVRFLWEIGTLTSCKI